MCFVEKGAKRCVLSSFLMEGDVSNKSSIDSSSTLEKHKDSNVQAHIPDSLSKGIIANDLTLQLACSSAIPHWMSTRQVQNIPINTSLKGELTGDVAPSTLLAPLLSLPYPRLGFVSEGETHSSFGIVLRDDLVNSRHLLQQKLPARPSLSVCLAPSLSLKRDGPKEEPETSKEDALSFFLHNQEKAAKELPILSLGHSSGQLSHQRADVSSWVSKFPFQISLNSELAEGRQLIQHRDLGCRLVTNAKSDCLIQDANKGAPSVPSQLMGSKGHIDHCNFLVQNSLSLTGEAIDVFPQKMSLVNSPLDSSWSLPTTISGSNGPSLKQDWNATFMQGVKQAQLLPDFFAQQKVTVVSKANRSHFVKSEDPKLKATFSQKTLASRVNKGAGFNFPSLHGALSSDNIGNSSVDYTSIKKQEMDNEGETLKRRTPSKERLQDSLRQVDLLRVKPGTLSEDSEMRESKRIACSEGRALTEPLSFSSGLAVDQSARQPSITVVGIDGIVGNSQAAELMLFRDVASTQVSTITSASVPSLPFGKCSPNLKGLEGGKVPANMDASLNGDWGDFLAAPRMGQTTWTDGKLVLPFQQRFEQLQKFLKKCDGSDKEYCLQALCSLSGSARSYHSAELESRAMRLFVEEGKELKRAKLLNLLEEFPEGAYMNPYARPMPPWFSASTDFAVVEEKA